MTTPENNINQLLLASGSPRRRELLTLMGLRFEVFPAEVEEWEAHDAPPDELVRHNAALKAAWAAERRPDELILASDTTVALDGHVLNKPADLDEARAMLRRLSGRTHTVFTALALRCDGLQLNLLEHVTSSVTFRELDAGTIESYFNVVNPLDKAGAYGIQEGREMIIAGLDGSLHNVMGLPTERLEALLRQENLWDDLQRT